MLKRMAFSSIFLLATISIAAGQAATSTQSAQPPTQSPAQPRATPPPAPHTNLKVGQPAPDFTLPSSISGPDGRKVRYKLSDFKGKKNVVLAFYVFAFTGG